MKTRVESALAVLSRHLLSLNDTSRPDPHLVIFPVIANDPGLWRSWREANAAVVCGAAPQGTSVSRHRLSGRAEAHAAQALLALVSHSGIDERVGFDCGAETVGERVDAEVKSPAYGRVSRYIEQELPKRLRAIPLSSARQEDAGMLKQKMEARQELASLDLSWLIQSVVIAHAGRSVTFASRWDDSAGHKQSLPELIRAQLAYTRLGRHRQDLNFVPEYGVHTVAMLQLVVEAFAADRTALPFLEEYRRSIAQHREWITSVVALRPFDPSVELVLAHLLQCAACRPAGLPAQDPRLRVSETADAGVFRLAWMLSSPDKLADSDSVAYAAHRYWALSSVRRLIVGGTPYPLRQCAVF